MSKSRFTFYSFATIAIVTILSWPRREDALEFVYGWELWYEPVLAGVICGILAALMGVYMMLNRIVFVSVAVAQGAGLGIFLTFMAADAMGLHLTESPLALLGGFTLSSIILFGFNRLKKLRHVPSEVLIGLMYVFSSGFIVLIGDRISEGRHHIDSLLFGNAVAIDAVDLSMIAGVTALILGLHWLFRREFAYASADPDFMHIRGLNVGFWQNVLSLTLCLSITASMKTLGSLPVFGVMLVPPFLALRHAKNLRDAFFTSLMLGILIPPIGYYFSYLYAFPTGASVILTAMFYVMAGIGEGLFLRLNARNAKESMLPASAA